MNIFGRHIKERIYEEFDTEKIYQSQDKYRKTWRNLLDKVE